MRPVLPSTCRARWAAVAIAIVATGAAVGISSTARATEETDGPAGSSWRPSASFELGVDSFNQIFRITDDLTGGLLDSESSFRDTTDVFTEVRGAAEFSLAREGPRLRAKLSSRLSTGTELDREGVEFDLDWRLDDRNRFDIALDLRARQFRDDVDFSLDSDNQEGQLRLQWRRKWNDRWQWGVKTRVQMLRFDTRSIYELDADRLDVSGRLVWRDGWRHWVDIDAGVGTKDVRDSTQVSYDHFFANADLGIEIAESWRLELRPSVERRVYSDPTVRRPFWDLSIDSQLQWTLGEHWRMRGRLPLEWLRPDENTSVYFDIFNGRAGTDLSYVRGAMEVGVEPRWSWLSSTLEVEDAYTQPSLLAHIDYFGGDRWWITFSEEWGVRRYTNEIVDGLDLYSDYKFFRTSVLGGVRLSEHLSFEFYLSDEPERHRRDADDSRLTLISASIRASM